MSIHDFLRELREMRGLSVRALAGEAGLGHSVINKAETPGVMVRGKTLAAILRGLGFREGQSEFARALSLWTAARIGSSRATLRARLASRIDAMSKEELVALQEWLERKEPPPRVSARRR